MIFMDWFEVEDWINSNICADFVDDDVNLIYELLFRFNKDLLQMMLNEVSYKLALKHAHMITPYSMDRDMILDNLKDLILVGGCQDYTIDGYMDWEGFVQAEIDEEYEEFNGEYIRYDDLEEFFKKVGELCIL